MHNNNLKDTFIHEFSHMKNFNDIVAADGLNQRIKAYISMTEADVELENITIVLDAIKEDYMSSNFTKCAKIAKPIFNWAKTKTDLQHLDIIIITSVLHHTPDYKLANKLAKKLIDALTSKYSHMQHKRTLFQIYGNMTYRLLRAMYYEIKDRVKQKVAFDEIRVLLDHYAKLSLDMCEEYKLLDYKEVILVRLALANANCEGIINGLYKLKKLGAQDLLKTSHDEVDEYLTFFNDKLTTALRNLRTGIRIQKCRLAAEMTMLQLADALDIAQSQINAYETGERGMKRTRLVQVADILGTSVTYLSGEDKAPPKLIDDIILHKLIQILRQATEEDKEYLLDHAIRYMKHQSNIRKTLDELSLPD